MYIKGPFNSPGYCCLYYNQAGPLYHLGVHFSTYCSAPPLADNQSLNRQTTDSIKYHSAKCYCLYWFTARGIIVCTTVKLGTVPVSLGITYCSAPPLAGPNVSVCHCSPDQPVWGLFRSSYCLLCSLMPRYGWPRPVCLGSSSHNYLRNGQLLLPLPQIIVCPLCL